MQPWGGPSVAAMYHVDLPAEELGTQDRCYERNWNNMEHEEENGQEQLYRRACANYSVGRAPGRTLKVVHAVGVDELMVLRDA